MAYSLFLFKMKGSSLLNSYANFDLSVESNLKLFLINVIPPDLMFFFFFK